MPFYCVTKDSPSIGDEPVNYRAHEYPTQREAQAFDDGLEYVNDSSITSLGVHQADDDEAAIAAAREAAGDEDDEDDEDDG